jgi:hypothetical protein
MTALMRLVHRTGDGRQSATIVKQEKPSQRYRPMAC